MRIFNYDIQLRTSSPQLERRSAGSSISDLIDPSDWFLRSIIGGAQSATGIKVTPLRALGVATVLACVRVRADIMATLPLQVRQREGRGYRLATDHPLWDVLRVRPNDEMNSADSRWSIEANKLLAGSGYAQILRDLAGRANGIYPVEYSRMDVYRQYPSTMVRYRVTDIMRGGVKEFPARDILHFKSNTFNGVTSLNTTIVARECIALALAMQDNAAKFFGNGSRPNGVLTHPLSLSTPAQERLKQQFEEQAGGQNLYRLMLLEEGMQYMATRSENKDSQFLESKDSQNLEICRVYGVPPHKVGITGGQPRANIEEENIGFVADVIRPACVWSEMEMDNKLFTPTEQKAGYCTYYDLDALMRGNMAARATANGAFRQWGIKSANDCRREENLPEVLGGDTLLQPINMIDSDKATEYQMTQKTQPTEKQGGNGGKPDNPAK